MAQKKEARAWESRYEEDHFLGGPESNWFPTCNEQIVVFVSSHKKALGLTNFSLPLLDLHGTMPSNRAKRALVYGRTLDERQLHYIHRMKWLAWRFGVELVIEDIAQRNFFFRTLNSLRKSFKQSEPSAMIPDRILRILENEDRLRKSPKHFPSPPDFRGAEPSEKVLVV